MWIRIKSVWLCITFLFHFQVGSLSQDYSIPALQKCDVNRLPDRYNEVLIPSHRMSINAAFVFRLAEQCATRLPHCLKPCDTPKTQLEIAFTEAPSPEPTQNSSLDYYDVYEPIVHFTPKGYLRVDNEYFSTDDYCVYSQTKDQFVVKICPSKCGGQQYSITSRSPSEAVGSQVPDPFEVCVPKCCSLHKVFDLPTDSCVYTKTGTPWAPLVYRSANRRICGEKRVNLKLHYMQTAPDCDSFHKYFLKSVPGSSRVRFRLLTNGTVLLRELGASHWTTLEMGSFCLDGVQFQGEAFGGDSMDQVLLLCDHVEVGGGVGDEEERGNGSDVVGERDDVSEDRLTASGIAYIILLFSGIPFLLITAIVYMLVWGQQNVHGWTLFSHTFAVLLHYLAQGIANTVSRIFTSDQSASSVCTIVGILNHYFVLAAFFWLTVINYDLFSMFRHLKSTVGRSRGMKRFLVYSACAWGIPLIVVCISVVLDKLYGLYGDDGDCEVDVVVPLYGHKSCYMTSDARPLYLYYPIGVIMIANLVLALMTFVNMYRHDQESRKAHGDFKRNTKHRRKFSVMAKLFVVMGLVWFCEIFVWWFIKENEVLPWYLVFPDVFNAFQAVAIFLLFACQPKILNQVADKYPGLRVFTDLLKRLNCGRGPPDKQQQQQTRSTDVGNGAVKTKSSDKA